jgi:hypothetical protein
MRFLCVAAEGKANDLLRTEFIQYLTVYPKSPWTWVCIDGRDMAALRAESQEQTWPFSA